MPWFVGKDVAEALGYKDTDQAIRNHVDAEDKHHLPNPVEMTGLKMSNYGAYFINESGVYSLIFGSKLEGAKEFKRWVTAEVLPAIRKSVKRDALKGGVPVFLLWQFIPTGVGLILTAVQKFPESKVG